MINHVIGLFRCTAHPNYRQIFLKNINETATPHGIDYTLYFQVLGENVYIPIDIPRESGQRLMLMREKAHYPRPHVYDTMKRVILCLGGAPKAVLLAMYSGGIYYTFIQVERGNKSFEIDTKFVDAISMAIVCKLPIFVEQNLCKILGVNIDQELEGFMFSSLDS